MQKLLETTQVPQSVMVLSLHYIHRLKERNLFTPAQSGSEFQIAVAGLMMTNKFLDEYNLWLYQKKKRDYSLLFSNTFTNKTLVRGFWVLTWKKLIEWSANFLLASILTYMWTNPPMNLGSTFSKGWLWRRSVIASILGSRGWPTSLDLQLPHTLRPRVQLLNETRHALSPCVS